MLYEVITHATSTEHLASSLIYKTYKEEKQTSKKLLRYLGKRNISEDFFSYRGELKSARANLFADKPTAMMQAFLLCKQNRITSYNVCYTKLLRTTDS